MMDPISVLCSLFLQVQLFEGFASLAQHSTRQIISLGITMFPKNFGHNSAPALWVERNPQISQKSCQTSAPKHWLIISQLMSGKRGILSGTNLFQFSWCQVHLAWRSAQRVREVVGCWTGSCQRRSVTTPRHEQCCVVYTESSNVLGG